MAESTTYAYVGNWRIDATGLGIAICRLDPATGALEILRTVAPEIAVGETYVDAERGILYVADERSDNPDIGQGGGGRVFAFRIDPATGDLTEINHRSSFGSLVSFVTTDAEREYLLATNHSKSVRITTVVRDADGSFRVVRVPDPATTVLYRLAADGSIDDACDVYVHEGEGPAPRHHPPAAHCVVRSPNGRLFVVCDKGTDEVLIFRIDREAGTLVLAARHQEPSNTSPRYARFHPTAPYLYVNHENRPSVTVLRYDDAGALEWVDEVDALPENAGYVREEAEQSDLLLSADGTRLYSLIRRAEAVSVFDVTAETGSLRLIQTFRLAGVGPRGGVITPDGRYLLVAQVGSEDVATLAIDGDGMLTDTGLRTGFTRPGNISLYTTLAA